MDDHAAAGGQAELGAGLADPGEYDPAGPRTGPQNPQQLPAADHVEAGPKGSQPPQQGQVAVGLDRVEDLAGPEGGLQAPVGGRHRVHVVQVEGGAGRPGELVDGQAADMEHTLAVGERLAAVEVERGCRGHAASSDPVRRAGVLRAPDSQRRGRRLHRDGPRPPTWPQDQRAGDPDRGPDQVLDGGQVRGGSEVNGQAGAQRRGQRRRPSADRQGGGSGDHHRGGAHIQPGKTPAGAGTGQPAQVDRDGGDDVADGAEQQQPSAAHHRLQRPQQQPDGDQRPDGLDRPADQQRAAEQRGQVAAGQVGGPPGAAGGDQPVSGSRVTPRRTHHQREQCVGDRDGRDGDQALAGHPQAERPLVGHHPAEAGTHLAAPPACRGPRRRHGRESSPSARRMASATWGSASGASTAR